MHIRDEVDAITKRIGRPPNNIEQFAHNKSKILEIKELFSKSFNRTPTLNECVYILENGLSEPLKCKHPLCNNFAAFHRGQYNYCCRKCSDTDPNRNKTIQEKRIPKIDYVEVHKKVVETKNIIREDGLNIHQRASIRGMQKRNENYDDWLEKATLANKSKTEETKIKSAEKRIKTIFERYNVTHFGGGYSKIKILTIHGKQFMYQGYEDVALYDLIFKHKININDIESCVRFNKHAFKYEFGTYYPDLFIISQNKYIEVKSLYWDNKDKFKDLKKQSVLNSGFNFEKILYHDKKYIDSTRKILKEQNCYSKS